MRNILLGLVMVLWASTAFGSGAQAQSGCTHQSVIVTCPSSVADGAVSLFFSNGGLNINWSDGSITLTSGCCSAFMASPSPAPPSSSSSNNTVSGSTVMNAPGTAMDTFMLNSPALSEHQQTFQGEGVFSAILFARLFMDLIPEDDGDDISPSRPNVGCVGADCGPTSCIGPDCGPAASCVGPDCGPTSCIGPDCIRTSGTAFPVRPVDPSLVNGGDCAGPACAFETVPEATFNDICFGAPCAGDTSTDGRFVGLGNGYVVLGLPGHDGLQIEPGDTVTVFEIGGAPGPGSLSSPQLITPGPDPKYTELANDFRRGSLPELSAATALVFTPDDSYSLAINVRPKVLRDFREAKAGFAATPEGSQIVKRIRDSFAEFEGARHDRTSKDNAAFAAGIYDTKNDPVVKRAQTRVDDAGAEITAATEAYEAAFKIFAPIEHENFDFLHLHLVRLASDDSSIYDDDDSRSDFRNSVNQSDRQDLSPGPDDPHSAVKDLAACTTVC